MRNASKEKLSVVNTSCAGSEERVSMMCGPVV
jgi:hypothetical protein